MLTTNDKNNGNTKIILKWRNISIGVKKKKHTTLFKTNYEFVQIIQNVSGISKSQSLLAIMGASGAGKTSLLAAISKRTKQFVTGDIYVNDEIADRNLMENISGFIPQNELLSNSLTIFEHMLFMARLKMDKHTTNCQRKQRIISLLNELGLNNSLGTLLGELSGGELKRLSLAVQLLNDPPILFCDEPTTGLDSYNAIIVTKKLKHFAEKGKAVICTIHQPASGLFEMFDQIVLLADGKLAYFGNVSDAGNYFENINLKCPLGYNQAEYFVSQLAISPDIEQECLERIHNICEQFKCSDIYKDLINKLDDDSNSSNHSQTSNFFQNFSNKKCKNNFKQYTNIKKVSEITQLYWLCWRSVIEIRRNYRTHFLRFCLFIFIALLIATPYVGITNNIDQANIQNMEGLLYLIITETVFTFIYSVLHTFPSETSKLLRELANGLYKPTPYYLSKIIVNIPKTVFETFVYTTIIFWIVGLQGGFFGYLLFCLPVITSALAATAYGSLISISFESTATASLVSVPVDFVGLAFSGVYLNLSNLPNYLYFLKYFSIFYYGIEAVSVHQWFYIDHIDCNNNQPEFPCIQNGDQVLEKYGFDDHFFWDIHKLLICFCVCHILGYIFLRKRSKRQPIY